MTPYGKTFSSIHKLSFPSKLNHEAANWIWSSAESNHCFYLTKFLLAASHIGTPDLNGSFGNTFSTFLIHVELSISNFLSMYQSLPNSQGDKFHDLQQVSESSGVANPLCTMLFPIGPTSLLQDTRVNLSLCVFTLAPLLSYLGANVKYNKDYLNAST